MEATALSESNATTSGMSLPSFISVQTDSVLVNLPLLRKFGGFQHFVEHIFSSGFRFAGLDYDLFCKLLYTNEFEQDTATSKEFLKIANAFTTFPESRRKLYHTVKLMERDSYAEYFFEPILAETTTTDATTPAPTQLVNLDIDEFITDMWLKNVRFGLNIQAIQDAIQNHAAMRVTIAEQRLPTPGKDAQIKEIQQGLHCDNSPKVLANGRVDWSSRKNRFPQVHRDAVLLKKIPRELGKPGYKITGKIIEPEIPHDINFAALCGQGTHLKQEPDGEYILAAYDGFFIFEDDGTVSVTEKIENRWGVSSKTTGNLNLDVEEYIEHGEVQEKCVVRGKNMTFMSDVFGQIISDGGNIFLAQNLSGGSAETSRGNVTLGKRASQASVRAFHGEVTAELCEHTNIMAQTIHIERAVNCELIAQTIIAKEVEGCLLIGENIQIGISKDRRDQETLVTMLIPDLSELDKQIAAFNLQLQEVNTDLNEKRQALQHLKSDPEFAKFLALHEQIKSGSIKLSAEQATQWQKLTAKHSTSIKQLVKLSGEANELGHHAQIQQEMLQQSQQERDSLGANVQCQITEIYGHTTVQTIRSSEGIDQFYNQNIYDIRQRMQTASTYRAKIYASDSGEVDWSFKPKND